MNLMKYLKCRKEIPSNVGTQPVRNFFCLILLTVMVLELLMVCSGCSSEKNTIVEKKEIDFNAVLQKVGENTTGFDSTRWNALDKEVSPDGSIMTIESSNIGEFTDAAKTDRQLINLLNKELGFKDALNTKIVMTELDEEKQSYENDEIKITWCWEGIPSFLTGEVVDFLWTYIYEKKY